MLKIKYLRNSRKWLLLAPVLFSGACTEEDNTPIASPELLESGASSVIYLLSTNIAVDGIREGLVEADTAYLYPDSSVYSLRNPLLVLYDDQGRERARVLSRSGRFNISTQELIARGDVILTISNGARRVETQELNYDPRSDRIWSDSATVMHEEGSITRGQSFESDLDFSRAIVLDGSITSTGGGPPPPIEDDAPPEDEEGRPTSRGGTPLR